MVGAGELGNFLALPVALLAAVTAIAGVVMLEIFFRNKLKTLFDDVNYFIFFFLVAGYFLYSLGEVSFYLTSQIFQNKAAIGIADVYWTGGALLVFISFATYSFILFRRHFNPSKLLLLVISGGVLLLLVLYIILTGSGERTFFSYFYPIISSLIVISALGVVSFSKQIEDFSAPLFIFFLASVGILIGDLFFTYETAHGLASAFFLDEIFYFLGYGLSALAFITMRFRIHNLSLEN